jgi:hypothetical protein
MRPEWEGLEAAIAAALEWLATPQRRKGALTTHFGYSTHVGDNARLAISTHGDRDALIILTLPDYMPEDVHLPYDDRRPYPTLTLDEVNEVIALIEKYGGTMVDRWNGEGHRTGSFQFSAKIQPSVRALQQRYHDHCPKHGSVFCGERATWKWREGHEPTEEELDEANCTWFSGGYAAAVPPAWPIIAPPEFAPPGPSEDTRNLLAVKKALEQIHRVCGDMGIVPQTVVAGKRGQINGETDERLEFEYGSGFGVTFSAEAALRLMDAALAAYESGVLDDRR